MLALAPLLCMSETLSSSDDVTRLYLTRRREQKAASYAVRSGHAALTR